MIFRQGNYTECLPLLQTVWPDSFHIFPIDNSLGLVKWTVLDIDKTSPTFYVIEVNNKVVATLHVFNASEDTICLRGMAGQASLDQWQALFNMALSNVTGIRKAYTVFKEPINTLVESLGFTDTQGPFWTNDWKVFLAWKKLND
jgi:hypothetical protein